MADPRDAGLGRGRRRHHGGRCSTRWTARWRGRRGLASEFGARFDMETDALLMLVLCLLVLHFGKAGAWVLAAGVMRYAFVLAARLWPWLARPLPPSRRRKAVCVVQITSLIVCLGPIVPRGLEPVHRARASLAALSALSRWTCAWLARHRDSIGELAP